MFEFVVSENVSQNSDEFVSEGNIYSSTPRAEVKKKGKDFPIYATKVCKEVEV